MKREYEHCPKCNQSGGQRPGLRFVKGTAEAAFFQDGEVLLDWLECRKCGHRWAIAAGSVTAISEAER